MLITIYLVARSILAYYSFSDIIKNLFSLHTSGEEVLDGLNRLIEEMKDYPDMNICSPDMTEPARQAGR
ncbi:MAG: hypothetical protein EPN39_02000 [Chitinophagaceae bacterium]|nr:MAG: hypothetical protein EPN39_02000 [Chitinophagaceae bacterium]